jgi:hypothetical protein
VIAVIFTLEMLHTTSSKRAGLILILLAVRGEIVQSIDSIIEGLTSVCR